jgi:hypothetical protein
MNIREQQDINRHSSIRYQEILDMNIQEAIYDDIKQLAIHHRKMFEEIWGKKGQKLETTQAQ